MIMMVATVKVAVAAAAAVKIVLTVNLTGLPMDLNAVIQPGVSMALIVLH